MRLCKIPQSRQIPNASENRLDMVVEFDFRCKKRRKNFYLLNISYQIKIIVANWQEKYAEKDKQG